MVHDQYLRLGQSAMERQSAYCGLFATEMDQADLEKIRGATERGWPLGSERFKDQIECALELSARPPPRGRPPKQLTLDTMNGQGTLL